MEKVISFLENKINDLNLLDKNLLDKKILNNLYPFNKIEYIFSYLISKNIISFSDYEKIRNDYIKRNKYLNIFNITAPRIFGEKWAQNYLNNIVPELKKPNKILDKSYSGEYDFLYDKIKIEVKASRAVNKNSKDILISKALSLNSNYDFSMNFQQIKPDCSDIFIFIGVWTDAIKYWIFSSNEIKNNYYYTNKQHRGNNNEGQLWIKKSNIEYFYPYEVKEENILNTIVKKYKKIYL